MDSDMEEYRVHDLPHGLYYITNFLSPEEEQSLLDKIPPKRWTELSHRRLQSYPSPLAKGYALIDAPLPDWLRKPCVARMIPRGIWMNAPHQAPNHCLINQYEPGEGIMPHEDGPAYFPMVATVSLGSHIVLNLQHKRKKDEKFRVLQEPGSLLISTDYVYGDYLHGIEEVTVDKALGEDTIVNWSLLANPEAYTGDLERKTRTSLTFRDVLKVVKVKF